MTRVLLTRMSSLGDVIHTLPAATDLRRALPQAQLDWIVEEDYAPLVRLHPGVTRVVPIALRRWRRQWWRRSAWREIAALRRRLREQRYDAIIDTQGLLKSALVARLARGPVHGFGPRTAREPLATRLYRTHAEFSPADHKVERYRQVPARALGYTPGALDYGLAAPPRPAAAPAGRYAVLLHSTARADKLWGEAHWIELGRWLQARGLAAVLPWGSDAERARAQRLAAAIPQAAVPPRLALLEAAGLIAHAALVVGVDTGLMHLAAALRVPVVGVFCGSEPLDAHPLGTGPIAFAGAPGRPPPPREIIGLAERFA
ncbi:MAG TPA: lipopolysaccharide heptosyltransferase I [Burkholderiales bacterium]|nr:lipopolysaccharide heptosyltransferase I [Burkholderiales bacterium]